MREHIYEVVDDDVELVVHQVGQAFDEAFSVLCVEHFVVGVLEREAVASQVLAHQFRFELVFEAFFVFVDPVLGVFAFYLGWHQSREHRVACKLGCGGDDAVVYLVALYAQILLNERLDVLPLVVAEVVDDYHKGGPFVFEEREQAFAHHGG